jgi:hypothetical protein
VHPLLDWVDLVFGRWRLYGKACLGMDLDPWDDDGGWFTCASLVDNQCGSCLCLLGSDFRLFLFGFGVSCFGF